MELKILVPLSFQNNFWVSLGVVLKGKSLKYFFPFIGISSFDCGHFFPQLSLFKAQQPCPLCYNIISIKWLQDA